MPSSGPNVIALVEDTISHETSEALTELQALADSGEMIGIAFCGILRGGRVRRYFANAAGEAYRNPTFSRGMLRALDDKLAARVRGDPWPAL